MIQLKSKRDNEKIDHEVENRELNVDLTKGAYGKLKGGRPGRFRDEQSEFRDLYFNRNLL